MNVTTLDEDIICKRSDILIFCKLTKDMEDMRIATVEEEECRKRVPLRNANTHESQRFAISMILDIVVDAKEAPHDRTDEPIRESVKPQDIPLVYLLKRGEGTLRVH